MAAAISLLVILTVSVFITRLAAMALRMTGIPEAVARFQCLSALSGTGYTTSEAEMIVNYPIRRRIIALLMIIGNVGILSLSATFVVSFLRTDINTDAIMTQLAWFGGSIVAVWLFMLNPVADQLLCGAMGKVLQHTTRLGKRRYQRTLQVSNGLSVAEHQHDGASSVRIANLPLSEHGLVALFLHKSDGSAVNLPSEDFMVSPGDRLILYGDDSAHEYFEDAVDGL